MTKIEATINISLDFECPECGTYSNLLNDESLNYKDRLLKRILENKSSQMENLKMGFNCPHCKDLFELDEMGY